MVFALNDTSDLKVRKHFFVIPIILIEWHKLNEPDFDGSFFNELDKVQQLIIVKSLHNNNIYLHLIKPNLDSFVYRLDFKEFPLL
jgi:hypothetical protein